MKKAFICCAIFLALFLATHVNAADENLAASDQIANPIEQVTGKCWLNSTQENKQVFLLGLDTAIAIELITHERMQAKDGKMKRKPPRLTPFVKAWTTVFKDTSRAELVKMVDDWYSQHPQDIDKPVMEVIWFQIIEPRLKAMKAGA